MARAAKPGIPYYSMDVDHTENTRIKLLVQEFDSHGYWIYQCILGKIYKNKGYYMDLNDRDEVILFATDVCKKQVSLVDEVINGCLRRGLFDKAVFEASGILTSDRIQLNYIEATKERRKKGTVVEFDPKYLLVKIPKSEKNICLIGVDFDSSRELSDSSREKPELLPGGIPQSKVKKSKEEINKEEKPLVVGFDEAFAMLLQTAAARYLQEKYRLKTLEPKFKEFYLSKVDFGEFNGKPPLEIAKHFTQWLPFNLSIEKKLNPGQSNNSYTAQIQNG